MTAASGNPYVLALLRQHPRIDEVVEEEGLHGCRFGPGREIRVGDPVDLYGLPELIDNNPLICADLFSLPSSPVVGALICLGPLVLSGLVREEPIVVSNLDISEPELTMALCRLGWRESVLMNEERLHGDLQFTTGSAVIETPADPEDLADLFDERFGRSLLIQRQASLVRKPSEDKGGTIAKYQISLVPDLGDSLATIRSICDSTGRLEAARIVNAMNIMSGWEDSLGLRTLSA